MKHLFPNILIISTILLQISKISTEEVPSFRIVAPQNLCKHNDSETGAKQPEGVTITFQPKDGIKLSYKFKIFFKIIGPEPLTQRETLLVWKAVRALEQHLNSKERLHIMKNNMALIKKTQVVPGVSYIFHVVGITDAGETSREQVFTIDYAEGVLQNSNVPEGINFLLIGSEEVVASIEYSVMAKVTFCKPKNDYYIQWKVSDLEERYQMIENTISSVLLIPPNALSAERKTAIEAEVKESGSNRLLAKEVIWVEILNKGFQAMIIPCAARIGEGTHLTFRLFLRNYDRVQQLEIKWLVEDAITNDALQTREDNQQYFKILFEKAGTYQVVAQVKINDIVTKVKADIEVISSVFISYDFQEIPNLNPSSYEEFKFSVMVMNMVANCEASWLSAQEEGFRLIPSGVLDKEHYGYTKITNLEKYYLEEIIDFTNSTVNREITLNIPTQHIKTDIMWPGFEGDSMYKFRLDVTCPKPFTENPQQGDIESEPWIKVVTSYFIIDIHTNAPPQALMVLMDPLQGVALKTVFNINSHEAKDLLLDSPVSYELKVIMDKFELSFGKYFQYKTWETILPYTLTPLQIMVEICDIRQACSTIKNDTKLSINYEEFNNLDYAAYEHKVNGLFMRTDFQDALNYLIMATITFKNTQSPLHEKWLDFVKFSIHKEIDKLLEQPEDKIYINSDSKLIFVVKCKEILDYTHLMNKEMLEKLLEILENLMDYTDAKADLQKQARFKRSSRKRRIVNHSQQLYTKTQLTLLEDLLKSEEYSSQALQNFIGKITNLAKKMCLNEDVSQESLKSSLVSLTLRKMQGAFLQQHTTQINENVFDKLILQFKTINMNFIKPQAKYCLIIKSYNFKENLQDDISLIEYNIYEIIDTTQLQEIKLGELNKTPSNVQLDIYPLEQHVNKCLMKTSYTAPWSPEPCKSLVMGKFLRCSCSQTGFLKTALVNIPSTLRPIINNDLATAMTSLPTFISLTTRSVSTFATSTVSTRAIATTTSSTTMASFVPSIKPETSNDMQVNPTTSSSDMDIVQKASPLTYIIPLILVLILLLFGILYILHHRRLNQASKIPSIAAPSTVLEFRQPASGIRYANIYDDHLLSGNF
ncbi:uncharacterized protein LOC135951652 [Calliphora vicina]|uniref:uncharacterized protein LOC135951652 n=1 Tax=Calliphora vicina TaxID=7373 RepID=UPI00325ADCF0